MEGDDIYSLKIGYACPCGLHWTYFVNQNSLEHGLPVEEDDKAATTESGCGIQTSNG